MMQKESQERMEICGEGRNELEQDKNSLIDNLSRRQRILRPQRRIIPTKGDPGKGQEFGIAEHLERGKEACNKESPGSGPLGSGPVLSFQNKDTSGGQKYLRKTLHKEAWEV